MVQASLLLQLSMPFDYSPAPKPEPYLQSLRERVRERESLSGQPSTPMMERLVIISFKSMNQQERS